jgi:glutamate synthase (NADPH/NADH)
VFLVSDTAAVAGTCATVELERKSYLLRKRSNCAINEELTKGGREWSSSDWHWCSLSSRTIVYKGMLRSLQVMHYFTDLECEDFTSSLCMVHSRFSTNTFPSWDRAQPCRQVCHNGEINTLKGNLNYARSRQGLVACEGLGISKEEVKEIIPIIEDGMSDSGCLNSMLELLVACGRPMPECVMMMIPEAWQNDPDMDPAKRDLYEFNSAMSEPWDGPAHVAFTDGNWVGATLDRNGLRPGRFYETHDNKVIASSETGVVDVAPENIKRKGRLKPGQIFVLNFDEQRIVEDEEVKRVAAAAQPYGEWIKEQAFGKLSPRVITGPGPLPASPSPASSCLQSGSLVGS